MRQVVQHVLKTSLCGVLLFVVCVSAFPPPLWTFEGTDQNFLATGRPRTSSNSRNQFCSTSSAFGNVNSITNNAHACVVAPLSASAAVGYSPGSPAIAYMGLLALQFACQPTITKTFAPPHMVRSTYVLAQEVVRFLVCALVLAATGRFPQSWALSTAMAASVPAALYAVQNYCSLMAFQNLAPLQYNVLNQTKTLSAAFFCYVLLGKPQSKLQIMALLILLGSSLIIEKVVPIQVVAGGGRGSRLSSMAPLLQTRASPAAPNPEGKNTKKSRSHLMMGVVPILLASMISGLAGTLCQKSLRGRDPFLFSMELSTFTLLTLLVSLVTGVNPDGPKLVKEGATVGWTWQTWIPITTNAVGGLLTTLVTKHVGAVRKGFALIFGLLLSGLIQDRVRNQGSVTMEQWVGGGFAALSLWMHASYPLVQQAAY